VAGQEALGGLVVDERMSTSPLDGDQTAVRWRAQTRLTGGGSEGLAGGSLLRFGEGLVVKERGFSAER
jgi:hypothetical protein